MSESFQSHSAFVKSVFQRVASKYDIMNDLMSFGIHRIWKRQFVNRVTIKPNAHYVDIAAGTGDITQLLYKAILQHGLVPHVSVAEPNEQMIEQGKAKLIDNGIVKGISWIQAAAEELPFEDSTIDTIVISFGLRNVTDIPKALKEFYRVLKPGGQFLCLEFSHVQHNYFKAIYNAYSAAVIPKLGKLIAGDQAAYEYLVDSIRQFPDQLTLKRQIESTGFQTVTYINLTDGIVAIHEGWK
jgi:demethylmenaquinone methyltransferase/2-methoxy-6-polyprenyl-1,4-benzoquinol methylase